MMRTNFTMEDGKYIRMVKGDTLSFGIEIERLDKDLDSAYFSCKKNYVDGTYAFQKTLNNGITKLETGQYVVRVAPEDTKDIEAGKYFFDMQIGVNSDIFTILKGIIEIEQEITMQGGQL